MFMNTNGVTVTSVGSIKETEPPHPSKVDERLYIGLGKGSVSNTHTNYDMWKETISQEIGSFFNTSDVRIKEIELETNSTHGRTVGSFFVGEVWIDGVPLEFTAGYFGGRTGVLPEESGLDDDVRGALPEAPLLEELDAWWNDDWGTWDLEENATILVHDDGMPPWAKCELEDKINSGVAVMYESGIHCRMNGCTNSQLSNSELCGYHRDVPPERWSEDDDCDDSSTEQSFSERMNELADDLDEQHREQREQDVIQYLRDNRETFKAEITFVGILDSSGQIPEMAYIKLDIPTHGSERFEFHTPDGDGRGERLYEMLSYLGADLRHMDMIEGMYLPVKNMGDDGDWEVRLPSDSSTKRSWTEWALYKNVYRPSLPSVSKILALLILLGFFGSIGVFAVGVALVNTTWMMGGAVGALISFFIMTFFTPN